MTLGFLSGSRNFCKLLCVSCEVFVYTDTTGSIGWPSPAPRLHIDDCFEIHNLHWESLWSAVIEVTKIFCTRYGSANASSARGTCNFSPFTDLTISVFRKWVSTLCLPKSSLLAGVGSKEWFMRRTGVWVSVFRNSVIHQIFPEFLQPLRDVRTQRVSPFHRGFVFFGFGFLVGLDNNGSHRSIIRSTCELETGTGWESIPLRSSLSRVSLSLNTVVVGEVDELEEDVGWLLSWRCPRCWRMRTGGRTCWQAWNHDKNEALRVTLYSNTVFNMMWFLTVDPLISISIFIAKLSKR